MSSSINRNTLDAKFIWNLFLFLRLSEMKTRFSNFSSFRHLCVEKVFKSGRKKKLRKMRFPNEKNKVQS